MSLDLSKLERARLRGGKVIARCPACAEGGGDRKGEHLVVYDEGRGAFACAANPHDREHQRRIWMLAGDGGCTDVPPVVFPPARHTSRRPYEQDYLCAMTTPWRSRLYDHPGLLRKVTGWEYAAEVIRRLTMPALDAMCIIPAGTVIAYPMEDERGRSEPLRIRQDRLGFLYDGALKIRQPFGEGGGPRFLMMGCPKRPWRSFALLRPECQIRQVHVAEGEHDAVELVACGFEDYDFCRDGSAVIGVPGSGSFDASWGDLFRHRHVTVWPDADEAGRKFAHRIADALRGIAPVSARISNLQLQEAA